MDKPGSETQEDVSTQQIQREDKKTSIINGFKENPKVVFYSIGACVSAMLWGFDIGVNSISTALPGFKLVFGYVYEGELLISATWNALWTAMTSFGMLVGGLLVGYISDYWGRRAGFFTGSALSVIGVGVMYAAESPGALLAAKIINGISLGFFLTLAPMYASEIAPTVLRPALTAAVNFFINAGQITAIGIGNTRFTIMTPDSYKLIFAAQWAFPIFVILFTIIMPESPWYLVRKDRVEDAKKSLEKLNSAGYDVDLSIAELLAAVETERLIESQQKAVSYTDCFRGSNFRRTRIVCGMFIVQQFTGIAFYAQALYFLGISGLPIALTFQLALGGFGVAMLGNIISWFIMDHVGRRSLLMTGVIINGLLLVGVGIAGAVPTTASIYFIGFAMNFAHLFYAPSVGAVTWALSAEMSSTQMRAKTQSLATVTNAVTSWAMNFITPYLINTDEANLGGKAAFVWVGLSALALVWVWFEVPEVKGRSYAALDELFISRVPTRKFKSTHVPEIGDPSSKICDP